MDSRDFIQSTPLHWAAWKDHTTVVTALLDAGADIEARDKDNRAPLHFAAIMGHLEVVSLLLRSGANPDARTNDHRTALHLAASEGHTAVFSVLLSQGKADIGVKNQNGETALDVAIARGHQNIIAAYAIYAAREASDRNGNVHLHRGL